MGRPKGSKNAAVLKAEERINFTMPKDECEVYRELCSIIGSNVSVKTRELVYRFLFENDKIVSKVREKLDLESNKKDS